MRRLAAKWSTGNAWPKRLEWMEIKNVRGWREQRISFEFPITAIVGENGSGKSTVLQCAACSYKNDRAESFFPTEFFPETTWDAVTDARIRCGHKRGNDHLEHTIRKPGDRWLGQVERPERPLLYLDLSRLQPIATRVGYARIAKLKHTEQP